MRPTPKSSALAVGKSRRHGGHCIQTWCVASVPVAGPWLRGLRVHTRSRSGARSANFSAPAASTAEKTAPSPGTTRSRFLAADLTTSETSSQRALAAMRERENEQRVSIWQGPRRRASSRCRVPRRSRRPAPRPTPSSSRDPPVTPLARGGRRFSACAGFCTEWSEWSDPYRMRYGSVGQMLESGLISPFRMRARSSASGSSLSAQVLTLWVNDPQRVHRLRVFGAGTV